MPSQIRACSVSIVTATGWTTGVGFLAPRH